MEWKFNLDEVAKANAKAFDRPPLAEGTYAMIIREVSFVESDKDFNKGACQAVIKQQCLADPEDTTSGIDGTNTTRYVTLPLPNPTTGYMHQPRDTEQWTGLLGALGLVDFPFYDKGATSWSVGGETINKKEVGTYKHTAAEEGTRKAANYGESGDGTEMVGRVYVANVYYYKKKDGSVSTWPSFGRSRPKLCTGETLTETEIKNLRAIG